MWLRPLRCPHSLRGHFSLNYIILYYIINMNILLIESNDAGEVNGIYVEIPLDNLVGVIVDELKANGCCLGIVYGGKYGVMVDTKRTDLKDRLSREVWGIIKKYNIKQYISKI